MYNIDYYSLDRKYHNYFVPQDKYTPLSRQRINELYNYELKNILAKEPELIEFSRNKSIAEGEEPESVKQPGKSRLTMGQINQLALYRDIALAKLAKEDNFITKCIGRFCPTFSAKKNCEDNPYEICLFCQTDLIEGDVCIKCNTCNGWVHSEGPEGVCHVWSIRENKCPSCLSPWNRVPHIVRVGPICDNSVMKIKRAGKRKMKNCKKSYKRKKSLSRRRMTRRR